MAFSEPEERIPGEVYQALGKNPKLAAQLRSFEGDPILARVVNTYRDHLVLGYASDFECQPKYAPLSECPVTDPELAAEVEAQIAKFAMPEKFPLTKELYTQSPMKFLLRIFSNIPALRNEAAYSLSLIHI